MGSSSARAVSTGAVADFDELSSALAVTIPCGRRARIPAAPAAALLTFAPKLRAFRPSLGLHLITVENPGVSMVRHSPRKSCFFFFFPATPAATSSTRPATIAPALIRVSVARWVTAIFPVASTPARTERCLRCATRTSVRSRVVFHTAARADHVYAGDRYEQADVPDAGQRPTDRYSQHPPQSGGASRNSGNPCCHPFDCFAVGVRTAPRVTSCRSDDTSCQDKDPGPSGHVGGDGRAPDAFEHAESAQRHASGMDELVHQPVGQFLSGRWRCEGEPARSFPNRSMTSSRDRYLCRCVSGYPGAPDGERLLVRGLWHAFFLATTQGQACLWHFHGTRTS